MMAYHAISDRFATLLDPVFHRRCAGVATHHAMYEGMLPMAAAGEPVFQRHDLLHNGSHMAEFRDGCNRLLRQLRDDSTPIVFVYVGNIGKDDHIYLERIAALGDHVHVLCIVRTPWGEPCPDGRSGPGPGPRLHKVRFWSEGQAGPGRDDMLWILEQLGAAIAHEEGTKEEHQDGDGQDGARAIGEILPEADAVGYHGAVGEALGAAADGFHTIGGADVGGQAHVLVEEHGGIAEPGDVGIAGEVDVVVHAADVGLVGGEGALHPGAGVDERVCGKGVVPDDVGPVGHGGGGDEGGAAGGEVDREVAEVEDVPCAGEGVHEAAGVGDVGIGVGRGGPDVVLEDQEALDAGVVCRADDAHVGVEAAVDAAAGVALCHEEAHAAGEGGADGAEGGLGVGPAIGAIGEGDADDLAKGVVGIGGGPGGGGSGGGHEGSSAFPCGNNTDWGRFRAIVITRHSAAGLYDINRRIMDLLPFPKATLPNAPADAYIMDCILEFGKSYDWVINLDDDAFLVDFGALYDLMVHMEEGGYDVCGTPDGLTYGCRMGGNPASLNPYFNVFCTRTLRERGIRAREDLWGIFHDGLYDKIPMGLFHRELLDAFPTCRAQNLEPYYPVFFALLEKTKVLYLYARSYWPERDGCPQEGVVHPDDHITSELYDHLGRPFLWHTWYARGFHLNNGEECTPPRNRDRILRVADMAYARHGLVREG